MTVVKSRVSIFTAGTRLILGLTAALEPLLEGLGHVEGQPLVSHVVADEAGGQVAGRGLQALVQLHPLLVQYPRLPDEHAQLGAG